MIKILRFLILLMLIPVVCFGGASTDFAPTGDFIDIDQGNISYDAPFTVSIWFYLDAFTDTFPGPALFDPAAGQAVDSQRECTLFINNQGGAYDGINGGSSASSAYWRWKCTSCDGADFLGKWVHFTITHSDSNTGDAETGYVMYHNGAVFDVETLTDGLSTPDDAAYIGRSSVTSTEWDGQLAYAHSFKGLFLSAAEVAEIMWKPEIITNSGIAYFYPLWENASPAKNISAGTHADGVWNGTPTSSSNGPPVMFGGGLPL